VPRLWRLNNYVGFRRKLWHAYRVQQAASVKLPYTVISIALILLAVLIGTFKLPKIETAERSDEKINDSVWKHRNLVLGAIGIFTYVGAEVSLGSFLVNYFGLPEIAGLSAKAAAGFVSFYWGGAMVGRFLGAPLLRRVKAGYLLALCAIAGATLVTVSMLVGGHMAMWTILYVGFFNSIMFPTIFSLGVAELGPLTGTGSGILNMAIVGGAILPVVQGAIADRVGLHHAFFLPVICYLFILFYGVSGSKPNSERKSFRDSDRRLTMLVAGDIGGTKTDLAIFSREAALAVLVDDSRSLAFCLQGDSQGDDDIYVMINSYWEELEFQIQEDTAQDWRRIVDTALPSPAISRTTDGLPIRRNTE
jgi:glucose/galactose transporter